jgi:hypothetical protein
VTINHYPRTNKDGAHFVVQSTMRDLFDPRSFGPSRRDLTRYVAPARPSRRLDLFDVRTSGPQHGERQLSRWRRDWHRHARWLAKFSWPERRHQ